VRKALVVRQKRVGVKAFHWIGWKVLSRQQEQEQKQRRVVN
jgi:hypothetical protein